ncbi:MAG: universal stress protein [Desulfobacter sp.]|nr:universal stress protein [Desulfobacter sp.]WDP87438.1 MAG: universal stress protein [Desulfobacter sp.]
MSANKILVTLDGSGRAVRTIDYLCNFEPLKSKQVVLFNVTTPVPESYYDLRNGPFSGPAISRVKAWEMGQKAEMEAFMADARMRLISAGFGPESVHVHLGRRENGIARDIIAESKNGYDALVIRRRGSAKSLLSLTLGGVASKLVDKADTIPLIVAGVQQVNHAVCIAVDGSPGALRAVRFAAQIIGQTQCRIVLCSVLRPLPFNPLEQVPDPFAKVELEALESVETAIEKAREILAQAGIKKENVEVQVIQKARSRAGALVGAAGEAGCDTLIFGRKGLSQVEGFDLGRIPRKVVYGSRKLTVWLVP